MEAVIVSVIVGLIVGILGGGVNILIWSKMARQQAEDRERQSKIYSGIIEQGKANMTLGKANARAMQRIPDAHCNGDMTRALQYAEEVDHRMEAVLREQVAAHL